MRGSRLPKAREDQRGHPTQLEKTIVASEFSERLASSRETTNAPESLFIGLGGNPNHPLPNPLSTDYSGFPRIYIKVGGTETLLDDRRRITERALQAGAQARMDIFPEMRNVFQILAGTAPEADDAVCRMAGWASPKLGLS